ncbi:hypothetical protein OROGR_000539 [Orobanche gracilis]
MKEKGKSVETCSNNFNFSAASGIPCKNHPNSPSVGICSHCLRDRLVKLVCSECGEQRLSSSCSCSDVSSSSYRNSCSTAMEVGSVGRVSFLIENDNLDPQQIFNTNPVSKKGDGKPDEVVFLRRSTSSCAEVKKGNGFWRIKSLFKKKTNKNAFEKGDIRVSDIRRVSRSRSLCSFRGFGQYDFDGESRSAFSSAKPSDVTAGGGFLDPERKFGGFSETFDSRGAKKQNLVGLDTVHSVPMRSVFPARKSDFSSMDESAFIDLKVDLSSGFKDFSGARMSCGSDHGGGENGRFGIGGSFANFRSSGGDFENERGGMKRGGGKSHKAWKWIFNKYHPPNEKNNK